MAPKKTAQAAPAVPPPPLPPTAAPAQAAPAAAAVVAEPVPTRDVDGSPWELHPVGTAQYIAELEAENADALAMKAAVAKGAHEGFKRVATEAVTHAAIMAGHLPQDINAIPGIDAINAAGGAQPNG